MFGREIDRLVPGQSIRSDDSPVGEAPSGLRAGTARLRGGATFPFARDPQGLAPLPRASRCGPSVVYATRRDRPSLHVSAQGHCAASLIQISPLRLRVRNTMKRAMRCHDFGSGLEESPAA